MGENLAGAAGFNDFPSARHMDRIRDPSDHSEIMVDEDHGHAEVLFERGEKLHDFRGDRHVESNGISVNAITTNALNSNALTANALTLNGLTVNSLTSNALTFNSLTQNALTINALFANGLLIPAGSALGELNGVAVEKVTLPEAAAR